MANIKVLLIEDDRIDQINFKRVVKNENLKYDYFIAKSISEAQGFLTSKERFDVVIADYILGDGNVFDILDLNLDLPIIFTTGAGDEEIAVKAMKSGAYDYLIKDSERNYLKILPITIENAIKHKKAERALRLIQFEHSVAGVFQLSTAGNTLECNETFAYILGYSSREEVVDERESIFYTSEDGKEFLNDLKQHWLLTNYELRLRHREGYLIYTLTNVSLLDGQKEGTKIIQGTLIDITDRKRIEAALKEERNLLVQHVDERTAKLKQANAELAEAARLKDEFLAGMSHELRTPLSAILGMSETLLGGLYGPISDDQQEPLRTIIDSGQHLLALISDILDVARIGAGKLELNTTALQVESICQASLDLVKPLAEKKQLEIHVNIDSEAHTLQADERRLKQILVNLLSNATKFTPIMGRIGLEVSIDKELKAMLFTVWDTGIGISEQDLKHLFKPFSQLDSRLSRQYGGTGLGLSLVYHMSEMHGGSVSVQSQLGQGSRFTVSLPWSSNIQIQAQPIESKSIPTTTTTSESLLSFSTPTPTTEDSSKQPLILLAEDNESNILIFSKCLQVKGYRVIVARDGSTAMQMARTERPNLILMDVQMPGMDGLEATRRLRADDTMADIPIIALTALAMPGDRERCLAAGVNDYLSKPVNLKELIRLVKVHGK